MYVYNRSTCNAIHNITSVYCLYILKINSSNEKSHRTAHPIRTPGQGIQRNITRSKARHKEHHLISGDMDWTLRGHQNPPAYFRNMESIHLQPNCINTETSSPLSGQQNDMSGSVPWYQTTPWAFIYRERLYPQELCPHTRMEPVHALVTLHHHSFRVDLFTKAMMLPLSHSLTCWAFVTALKGRGRCSFTSSTPLWTVRNRSLVCLPLKNTQHNNHSC